MPDIKVDDGCVIHAEVEGPERTRVLTLSNSLDTNLHVGRAGWPVQAAFSRGTRRDGAKLFVG